jgi:hypothetical protein
MQVSIAGTDSRGRDFSAQPGDIIDIEAGLAKTWIKVGHAAPVPDAELTSRDLNLRDLDAEEALTRPCFSCNETRAQLVFQNQAYCQRCYMAVLGYPDPRR